MRLHIFSDLHLEFAPFAVPDVAADVVVVAGDVRPGPLGLQWLQAQFPSVPVIYVLGNHEFYGQDILQLTHELKAQARGSNIHILENDWVQIGEVIFLGATLWTDFELFGDVVAGQAEAAFQMTDYRRIYQAGEDTKFRPRNSRGLHLASRRWLQEQVELNAGNKTVIVTHHAPSPRSLKPEHAHRPINSAYASNLESFMEASRVPLWIHGHIHHCSDYVIGGTRVVTNPRGYPNKNAAGFNPGLIVEL